MRSVTLILAVVASPTLADAQDFDFYAGGPYREEVPRPASLLGYEPGEFHTTYGGHAPRH